MNQYDLIVVGGGPAGFFTALSAAEAQPNARILIVDKGRAPLAKVKVSGGGRCNVTHACFDPADLTAYYPRGGKELRGLFTRFQPRDTIKWFESHGVALKTEADGRIFPTTDRSETIIECLLNAVQQAGIKLFTECTVKTIQRTAAGFELHFADGQIFQAAKVMLAAGGGTQRAYQIAASLGHTIIPPVPSLFTFKINDARLKGLAGVSVSEAEVRLLAEQTQPGKQKKPLAAAGPLLITHWGLSGPAVLQLSAWGARLLAEMGYRAALVVNWLPQFTPDRLLDMLQQTKEQHLKQQASTRAPDALLPTRLWQRLVTEYGIAANKPWGELSKQALRGLAAELTGGRFQISGKSAFKEEFVTCGGIDLKEINFKTLESRICPGLYFAGEFMDIDGLTGGFNFQAAWTTGWLAGQAIVGS